MFIQCQHCHTTYKIDENKLPEAESVVRCAKCSEPIPLSRETQDEVSRKTPKKIVVCDQCGTQYSVPLNSIGNKETKARCGNCGNFFSISKPTDSDTPSLSPSSRAYEEDYEDGDIDLDNIEIPEESEIEVDDLFNNIDEKTVENSDHDPNVDDGLSSKDASDEYLESVKLTSENGEELDPLPDDEEPDIDEISEEQKYKIFLKPKSKQEKEVDSEQETSWPEIEDDLPDEEPELSIDTDLDEFTDLDDIGDAPRAASIKKEKKPKKEKKKRNILLWIIWIIVILALAGVGLLYFDFQTEEIYTAPQAEAFNSQSKIAILEPLSGRFIQNKNLKTNMFVLEGKLLNVYGENISVSGIEIEGYLYRKNSDQPITSTAFAGVYLDDELLKIGSRENIIAIVDELAEESKADQEFGSDDLIDFQIIFFDAPDTQNIEKLGARINRFNRRGP